MLYNKVLTAFSLIAILFLSACEKEDTKDVSTTLTVPTIEIVGDEFMSVAVGATYTDKGARYTGEDATTTDLQATSNTVNTSKPGLYEVTYSKKSASGVFETEAKRLVAVTYQENPVNYSGTYVRTTATSVASAIVTRLAPGFYRVMNPGGATGAHTGVTVYFIETALNKFEGPPQHEDAVGVGDIEIVDINFTPTGATWRIINNPFYGTGVRTFVKQ